MACFDPYSLDTRRCLPGMVQFGDWVQRRWGYEPLGCYAPRDVRGRPGVPSMHRAGRALDGRMRTRAALDELFGACIANADELGIQAMNDYENERRWRCDRGWQLNADIGPGAGRNTFHIERNEAGASDRRAIETILLDAHTGGEMARKYTAKAAIPWLPKIKGQQPRIYAEVDPVHGATHVTGVGCMLEPRQGGIWMGCTRWTSLDAAGKPLPLNAPITAFTVDPKAARVFGLADDGGVFEFKVRKLS